MNRKEHRKGFTLVELSIVLVIIGLLTGGILVAQSLIDSVRINRFGTEITQYHILAAQFKDRFKYIPGDHPRAFQIFGSACGANRTNGPSGSLNGGCNGDGDGKISQRNLSKPQEIFIFWEHLSLAGFLDEQYDGDGRTHPNGGNTRVGIAGENIPELTSMERYGIRDGMPAGILASLPRNFGASYSIQIAAPHSPTTCNTNCNAAFPALEALAIDSKFDDGISNDGIIRTQGGNSGGQAVCDYQNPTDDGYCSVFWDQPAEFRF